MSDLFFGTGAFKRDRGSLPELKVVNLTVEPSPSSDKEIVLQSRAGQEQVATVGAGPIHGMFQKNGAIGGIRYAVSGSNLYGGTDELGDVSGDDAVSFAASPARLLVTRGDGLHSYNGTQFVDEAFPDDGQVVAVGYLAGYEIGILKGTNQFYFRQYTSDTFDGLDFANAENEPDELRDVLVIDDILVFLGAESVEFWPKSGDAAIPFLPMDGRVFEKGVIGTGCACRFDNSFAWIGNEGVIYIGGNVPERISDAGIEEEIAKSTSFRLFGYFFEGTEYLVLRLSQGTWVLSAASKRWSEFRSYGQANWRVSDAVSGPEFGDGLSGAIWRFGGGHVDAGTVLERVFTAALPIRGGAVSINNIRLTCDSGNTPTLNDQYADPVIEMRTSRDVGKTWGNWRPRPLGAQGEYRTRVEWRACGMFDDPGIIAEFRVIDPVPFRLTAVAANEPGGGRGR